MDLKLVSVFKGTFPNVIINLGFTKLISSSRIELNKDISETLGGLLLIDILPFLPSLIFIGLKNKY